MFQGAQRVIKHTVSFMSLLYMLCWALFLDATCSDAALLVLVLALRTSARRLSNSCWLLLRSSSTSSSRRWRSACHFFFLSKIVYRRRGGCESVCQNVQNGYFTCQQCLLDRGTKTLSVLTRSRASLSVLTSCSSSSMLLILSSISLRLCFSERYWAWVLSAASFISERHTQHCQTINHLCQIFKDDDKPNKEKGNNSESRTK